MTYIHVESPEQSVGLIEALRSSDRIALDCEAAGFHRYSDRLCLVQITASGGTWILDPLAFDVTELLKETLEDPAIPVVMHGADFDLRLLSRDLGIRLRGLIDTQIQAALSGEEGLGLAALLEARLSVTLSKKYQRADWADRPLTDGMLAYAANDTVHLEALTDLLAEELEGLGRSSWAEEEFRALEGVADDAAEPEEPSDPVLRVKGAKDLNPREVTALRVALEWRDEIARQRDRATFRVIGDPPLIETVLRSPRRAEELVDIRGFPKALARERGKELLRRIREVAELPDDQLVPYPRGIRRGPGRPPPELEEAVDRLKAIRNTAAEELGLPRGTVLANAVLLNVAREAPKTTDELIAVDGMRRWKAAVVGERLLEVTRSL
ncbi:MAG: HRDC domain-containing protein [Gemmatimonadota bacterium]